MNEIRRGFKFLDLAGRTTWNGLVTQCPLPAKGDKWGPWFQHPTPAEPDGNVCGPGRWHVTKCIDAYHAPRHWRLWFAECRNIVGENEEKIGATEIRLREVRPEVFWRMIRLGWCVGTDLFKADLRCADLRCADLRGTNLSMADLFEANLFGADLRGTDLSWANLSGASLCDTNLFRANLRKTNLTNADLRGADLRGAMLSGANLVGANLTETNLSGANLAGAILHDVALKQNGVAV